MFGLIGLMLTSSATAGSTDVCTLGRMIAGGTVTDLAKRLDMKFMKFNEQDPYDDYFDQYWHNHLSRTTYVAQTSLWPEGCMSACCANPACQSFGMYKNACMLYSVATSTEMDTILWHVSRQGPWGIASGGPGYSIAFWEMAREAPVCNWAGANVGIGRCQVSREYVTSSGVGMHTPAGLAICKSACDADPRCVGVEQGFNNEYGGECSKVFTLACPRNNNRPWTGARYTTFICNRPSPNPTEVPTSQPTPTPTSIPTVDPTLTPSSSPTRIPTADPSSMPTANPTFRPSSSPTRIPTVDPTAGPTFQPTSTPTSMPSFSPTETPTEPGSTDVCTLGRMIAGGTVTDQAKRLDMKFMKFNEQDPYDDHFDQYWHNGLGRTTYVAQTSLWPEGCMSACCANPACQSFGMYKNGCMLYSVATSTEMDTILWHVSRQGPWGIGSGGPGYSIAFWEMAREVQERTGAGWCADADGEMAGHSAETGAQPNLASCKDSCLARSAVGWARLLDGSAAKPVGRCFCYNECRGFVDYPGNYFESGSIDPAFVQERTGAGWCADADGKMAAHTAETGAQASVASCKGSCLAHSAENVGWARLLEGSAAKPVGRCFCYKECRGFVNYPGNYFDSGSIDPAFGTSMRRLEASKFLEDVTVVDDVKRNPGEELIRRLDQA